MMITYKNTEPQVIVLTYPPSSMFPNVMSNSRNAFRNTNLYLLWNNFRNFRILQACIPQMSHFCGIISIYLTHTWCKFKNLFPSTSNPNLLQSVRKAKVSPYQQSIDMIIVAWRFVWWRFGDGLGFLAVTGLKVINIHENP